MRERLRAYGVPVGISLLLLLVLRSAAAEDYVTVTSVESSPFRCYVDGVEQPGTHTSDHKADQRGVNLAFQHPDADVRCEQHNVRRYELTAAGRALLDQGAAEPGEPEPPAEPTEPEEPEQPEEPEEPVPPPAGWPAEVPAPPSAEGLPACPEPTVLDAKWMELSAADCVSTGIRVVGRSLRVTGANLHVRDFEVNGNGQTDKVGVRITGERIVLERGKVHHLLGNDKHCFTASGGTRDVWIIESEGYYCSGDGFQAGHQSQNNPPTNFYLVRNRFHETRENGIDVKWMTNVIAVENEIWGTRSAASGTPYCLPDMPDRCSAQNSGSDGTAIIIGSDGGPTGWALYRNIVRDSSGCIRVEEANSEGVIDGNTCRDISGTGLQLDKKSGHITFIGNTIERASRGIFQNWRENFSLTIDGNTFRDISGPAIELEQRVVWEASTLTGNRFRNTGPVIYGNTQAATAEQINALPGASGNTVE